MPYLPSLNGDALKLLSFPSFVSQYSVESESDEEDVLDCGVLSETDVSSKMFTVHNLNPVEVCLAVWFQRLMLGGVVPEIDIRWCGSRGCSKMSRNNRTTVSF